MRVLIVEDDERLAYTLKDLMKEHQNTADVSLDGEAGLDNALSGIYDVIILDVMLPKLNGVEVIKQLREQGNHTPILMLTAKGDVEDKVAALESGADYYLTKPFESDELFACIQAITRRQAVQKRINELNYKDLYLNTSTYLLSCNQRSVRLSRIEFEIMRLFLINKTNIITKETIILKVWGFDADVGDNNVEAYISFLRKKMEHVKSKVTIKTLRLVGYCLEES